MKETVTSEFKARYGEDPTFIIRAPGRVNIIGEHTDYNDGFVLPMAINRAVWIALRPRKDATVSVYSVNFESEGSFDLTDFEHTDAGWIEYVKGVSWALLQDGYSLSGWEGVLAGDVPGGAGLSSSAALELAVARAFEAVAGETWDGTKLALAGQNAENNWVGANTGIMDQMISANGEAGHALFIDCRSLDTELVPLPNGTCIVVMDTSTRHSHVDGEYNERRAQCEAAAAAFNVKALRDVSVADFQAKAAILEPLTQQRARHVVTENERTLAAANAMKAGDVMALGQLMNASHVSMRDDFEISSTALDKMVEIAQAQPNCYGARMTGGGFAGCAVALVDIDAAEGFVAAVAPAYKEATGLEPALYVCDATDGARLIQDA